MQEGKPEALGKPTEASLDWKPNAHKCRNRELNPGLVGAKWDKIRYTSPLPLLHLSVEEYCIPFSGRILYSEIDPPPKKKKNEWILFLKLTPKNKQ